MTTFDPSHLEVRAATQCDVSQLATFIEPFVAAGKLLPRTVDELQELLACGFVAIAENRVVGFAALEIYSPKLGEIRSLAVSPELQGYGIGKQLISACLERAHENNVFEVMVITSNEGVFRSCGFDYTLPGEKKALFIQTREDHG